MTAHVLLAAPLMPEFDRESGSKRIFSLLQYLREAGYAVSFVAENPYGEERYARALHELGIAVYRGFGEQTDELYASGSVDVAVFAFWYLAEAQMPRLRAVSPRTRVLVDTIDLHFLRNARRLLHVATEGQDSSLDAEYGSETVRELTAYAQADRVICVSQKEAELVNDFLGRPGHAAPVADAEELEASPVPLAERRGILFVGNFRHPPNVEAAEHLCREVVPLLDPALLRRHPVSVVGNGLPPHVQQLAAASGGSVLPVGWVPSITPYLHRARVSVIPLLYGAGTKRKLIQALMVGTPTVSTTVGAEGLDVVDGQHLLIADDPETMAASLTRLLTDSRTWTRLARGGAERVRSMHGHETAREQLVRLVETALTRPAGTAGVPGQRLAPAHYRSLVEQVRATVEAVVPPQSTVAVVTRGDDALVQLVERTGWHYPQAEDGGYAGFHPADGTQALAQLQRLRQRGAGYLVVPQTSHWWLDHYGELADYLSTSSRRLDGGEACTIFDLLPGGSAS